MESLAGALDRFKHEIRVDLQRHEDNDERRFGSIEVKLGLMKARIDSWEGAFGFARWMLNLGIPAIIALLVALLVRQR